MASWREVLGPMLREERNAPRFDRTTVTILEIASEDEIPGGVSLCDGTWIARFSFWPAREDDRYEEQRSAKRAAVEALAERLGLEVVEREVSGTLAETWTLR